MIWKIQVKYLPVSAGLSHCIPAVHWVPYGFLGTLGARHKAPEGILQEWTRYGHTCKGRKSETANWSSCLLIKYPERQHRIVQKEQLTQQTKTSCQKKLGCEPPGKSTAPHQRILDPELLCHILTRSLVLPSKHSHSEDFTKDPKPTIGKTKVVRGTSTADLGGVKDFYACGFGACSRKGIPRPFLCESETCGIKCMYPNE